MTAHICPECIAGKCRNCDGYAWDNHQDDYTACRCVCQQKGASS